MDNRGGFPIDQGAVTERPSFIVGIREPLYAAQIHAPQLVTVTTLYTTLRDTVPFLSTLPLLSLPLNPDKLPTSTL